LLLGIVGFDRLAKHLLRRLAGSEDLVVKVLADPTPAATIAHLTRFDTVTGRFPGSVSAIENGLRIGEREVRLVAAKAFEEVDWTALGVDVVIDCKANQLRHLTGASPEPRPIPSAAEHAAGAMLEVLLPAFGVERAFVSEVRAYAADDRLADVPAVEFRQGRAAAESVSPRVSDLGRVLGQALPPLAGRISSFAIHVPVDSGAAIDLTCWHERPVTAEALLIQMRAAASGSHAGRIEVEESPIVSSDLRGVEAAAVFDAGATMVLGERVSKTLAWFDEESSRPARLIESLRGL
jgi:glyceraldehyde 3-phosphate dehydrogenase